MYYSIYYDHHDSIEYPNNTQCVIKHPLALLYHIYINLMIKHEQFIELYIIQWSSVMMFY